MASLSSDRKRKDLNDFWDSLEWPNADYWMSECGYFSVPLLFLETVRARAPWMAWSYCCFLYGSLGLFFVDPAYLLLLPKRKDKS